MKILKNLKLQMLRLKRKIRPLLSVLKKFVKKVNWKRLRVPGIIIGALTLVALTVFLISKLPPRAPRFKKNNDGIYDYQAKNKVFESKFGLKENVPTVYFNLNDDKSVVFSYQGTENQQPKLDTKKGDLVFEEVESNLDISYQTLPNGIKEEIILKAPRDVENNNVFIFNGNFQGAQPKEILNGISGTAFFDSNNEYLFHFEKPFAIDAAGNRTDNVSLQIEEKVSSNIEQVKKNYSDENPYLIRLSVDKNWLNDPSRVYPITIDPTIIHDESSEFATGQFNGSEDTGSGTSPSIETFRDNGIDDNTVVFWKFDESSGTSINDSSGNGNTGTATNTTIVNGKIGNARNFDGSGDYIADSSITPNVGSQLTLCAWIKTTGNSESIAQQSRTSSDSDTEYVFWINPSGQLRFWDYDGGTGFNGTSASLVNDGNWKHVCFVKDSTTGYFYIDGKLDNTISASLDASYGTNYFVVGADIRDSTYYFSGQIDEVMLSNKAYSAEEISSLKNGEKKPKYSTFTSDAINLSSVSSWNAFTWEELGIKTGDGETIYDDTNLIAQWNFNETSGTTASVTAGSCSTSCNGTLTSFSSTGSQDAVVRSGWTADNRRWGAGALMFDGDDYISMGSQSIADNQANITIESWIFAENSSSDHHRVFSEEKVIYVGRYGDQVSFYTGDGSAWTNYSTAMGYLSPGEWHYVVWVKEGTSGKVYIDGELSNTMTTPATLGTTSTDNNIGSSLSPSQFWNGIIDTTRIYSRALSEDEIISNYNSSNIQFQTRVGNTSDPNDGTWEAWSPITSETLLSSLDSDYSNWDNYTGEAEPSGEILRFDSTLADTGHIYWKTLSGNATLATGDTVEYDVYLNENRAGLGGFDIYFTDATYARDTSGWIDQNGVGCHPSGSINSYAYGQWFHRKCTVPSGLNGKTISYLDLTNSSLTADSASTYYDNIVVKNSSGAIKSFIYSNGTTSYNTLHFRSNASNTASVASIPYPGPYISSSNESVLKSEGNGSLEIKTGAIEDDLNTVGLWHFEETGGTGAYIKDSSDNGYDATPSVSGGTTEGINGKGFNINGRYGTISDPLITGNTNITAEFWVNVASLSQACQFLYFTSNGVGIGVGNTMYDNTSSNYGNHLILLFEAIRWINTGVNIGTGWHHIALVLDSSAVPEVYIDGVKAGRFTGSVPNYTRTYSLIGGSSGRACSNDNIIDDLKISNTARTAEEIEEDYRLSRNRYVNRSLSSTDLSSKELFPFYVASDKQGSVLSAIIGESAFANYQADSNTVALWHFDEKYGTEPIEDSSGNENYASPGGVYFHTFEDGAESWTARDGAWSTPAQVCTTSVFGNCSIKTNDTNGASGSIVVNTSTSYSSTDTKISLRYRCESGARWGIMLYNGSSWNCIQGSGTTTCGSSYTARGSFYPAVTCDDTWRYAYYDMGANFSGQTISQTIIGDWNSSTANSGKWMYFDQFQLHRSEPSSTNPGKIGDAMSFDGSDDIVNGGDIGDLDGATNITISAWIRPDTVPTGTDINSIISKSTYASVSDNAFFLWMRGTPEFRAGFYDGTTNSINCYYYPPSLDVGKWIYLVVVLDGTTGYLYYNGQLVSTATNASFTGVDDDSHPIRIGGSGYSSEKFFDGLIDEVRIDNVSRSATEIRQAYEVGKRTHTVTVNFAAELDSGNLIADSNDTSFTIDATGYGYSEAGGGIYEGEKIIVKENYNGTEYVAQGLVNSVNPSTGAITVNGWDTGSTFPSSGFTVNATVFKWQREYFDLSGIRSEDRDAITNLSIQSLDNEKGGNIWLDDLRYSGDYLTTSTNSVITSSIGNQYFQYRAILSSSDENTSASLSSVTLNYVDNSTPNTPTLDSPTDTATSVALVPDLKTTGTDDDSDYLQYKIELCDDLAMTTNCQTFNQRSSQTGWSGQDAESSTAYASGTQATYTLQSELTEGATYYWRSYSFDEAGSYSWSETQGTPYSFTVDNSPSSPTDLTIEETTNPTEVMDTTPEFSAIHNDSDGDSANYYRIEVNTSSDFTGTVMWDSGQTSMTSTANGARSPEISYAGTSLSYNGTTYYWRIRFWDTVGVEGAVSSTAQFTMEAKPNAPTLDSPSDTQSDVVFAPDLLTTATDGNLDYLRYKIQLCEDVEMLYGCQTFDQTSSQTGWSGQDAETGTAYASSTQATYTLQSELSINTTYYWRSYAIDPGGSSTWSDTQDPPHSFTTLNTPLPASNCYVQQNLDNSELLIIWTDNATNEDYYEVQRRVDGGSWTVLNTNIAANTESLIDTTISTGHSYQYRIAPYFVGPNYASWCVANTLNIGLGFFNLGGINVQGLNFN